MKKSILAECLRISRDKLNRHPELNNFPHYSFIIQNNKIIEWATNINKEPPIFYGYHKRDNPVFKPKFHSETFAYFKSRALLNNKKFSIINIRYNKNGKIKLSKPCLPCYSLMKVLGCSKIYYSSEAGFMELK